VPKKVETINQFHGGLNTFADPRDAVENQLTEANDLMVDELGKVRTFGGYVSADNGITSKGSADTVAGYGLFHFSHDYPGLGSTYTSGKGLKDSTAISTNYTVLSSAESSNQKFYIYGYPQEDKINVELIADEKNRTFSAGQADWEAGIDGGGEWGTGGTSVNFTYESDNKMQLVYTSGAAGIKNVGLSATYFPTTVGKSYTLTFTVPSLQAGDVWNIKNATSPSQTYGQVTASGDQSFDFVALSTGGLKIENSDDSQTYESTFDNFSLKEGGWSQAFSLGSNANFRMLPYNVDGQLRVTESNFNNTSTPKWFGYLVRDYMDGEKYNGWYTENATYTKPSKSTDTSGANSQSGKFSFRNSSTTSAGSHSIAAGAIHIELMQLVTSTGTWKFASGDETYKFYVSYIYDGGYDSGLEFLADTDDDLTSLSTDDKPLKVNIKINSTNTDSDSDWFTHHSPRIIGFRLYYEKIKTTVGISTPFLINESYFDANKGSRRPLSGAWEPWVTENGFQQTEMQFDSPPEVLSYEDMNGYSHDETVSAQFKSIVIVNRKAYIGNVKQDGIVHGDMMIKSPVNGFDLFPKSRSIEVSVRDGDDIIKLEEYADRILQFKKNKMHLINISQEIEFLEDTFMHKGVDYPTSTCKTDFGIAWVNKHGCYLYDGKQVNNLLENRGRKMISDADWQAQTANHVAIAYLPRHRQIIIANSLSTSGNKNAYLYDLVTGSWVSATQAFWNSSNKTISNIVIDHNGDLLWTYKATPNSYFLKWDNSSAQKTDFKLKTKALTFGNPSVRKKIYNVQISYMGDGTAIVPTYGKDGETAVSNAFTTGALSDVGTNDWEVATLVPSASVNNAKSFRLKLAGTAASDFLINDITVVYRLKSVK
tara:strand:+ start:2987 stop:5620 length:2634 start_codon:yes stop_codon:yes gene_type:complete